MWSFYNVIKLQIYSGKKRLRCATTQWIRLDFLWRHNVVWRHVFISLSQLRHNQSKKSSWNHRLVTRCLVRFYQSLYDFDRSVFIKELENWANHSLSPVTWEIHHKTSDSSADFITIVVQLTTSGSNLFGK